MIKKINPIRLFNYQRLDLIVKWLFAKDLLNKQYNDYQSNSHKDLYIRTILMRTMGIEPINIHSDVVKNNANDYVSQFENLINSIKKVGYLKESPVPISSDNLLLGGSHRIAASMALNEDIYIEYFNKPGITWNFEWFEENGFSIEDKMRILHGFIDINYNNSSIFIIWSPLYRYIDNIKSIINNYLDIVGDVELDFENNYIAFRNIILDIYEPNIRKSNGDDTTIIEKAKLLQANHLSFKVIVATNQNKNTDTDIHSLALKCKKDIRKAFDYAIPENIFASIHSSDSSNECIYLSNILLSPNNINHLKMRKDYKYNNDFLQKVRNLNYFLNTIGIESSNDICCIGSGVMTTLGIQDNSDIDFIIKYKYRDKFGDNIVYMGEYDIGVCDRIANRPKNISDDILIDDYNSHFYFKGVKFANLEMIKDRKKFSARDKDIKHLREIDLFEKLQGNFNQQKILFERIRNEQDRRAGKQITIDNKILILNNKIDDINQKIEELKINQYSNNWIKCFGIYNNKNYIFIYFLFIRFSIKVNDNTVNKIAWWIPVKKWREDFR
ncbi:hypothetical protein R4Q14_14975, partial [Brachyspira intermedia]